MYGAILGDIVGSPYEFDCNNYKAKNFPLFSQRSEFTDDTVMTLAVAKALLDTRGQNDAAIKAALVREMQRLGRAYPDRGYGTHFGGWLYEDDPQPYQSYGNGSAMRVSSAAWLAKDMAESLHLARLTAEVTHDHPEGIKGAQAVAAAIFLARTGHDKAEIKAYVEREFGYDLSRSCDEIRPNYHHVENCQETVPQAITAFLESTDFEDALRTAVSLGGDSDTLAAITGSIAEAFYGVPEELRQECRCRCGETREPQLTCGQQTGQHRYRPCKKHRRQRPHRADIQSAQRVRKGAERQREAEHPQRHARKHGRAEKAAHARERAHERKERCEREQELHARPRRDSPREACRSGGEQSGHRTGRRCGVERLRVRREVQDFTERQEREQRTAPSGKQSVRQSARLRSRRRRESSSVFLS